MKKRESVNLTEAYFTDCACTHKSTLKPIASSSLLERDRQFTGVEYQSDTGA